MSELSGCLPVASLLLSLLAASSAQIPTITPSFCLKFQNDSFTLSCLMVVPADKVVWKMGTDNLNEVPDSWDKVFNKSTYTAYLTVPKHKDESELSYAGNYSCQFLNNNVPASGIAITTVRASPSPGKGKYLSHQGSNYVMQSLDKKEGDTVSIKCSVLGYPKPQIIWAIGSEDLKTISESDRIYTEGDMHNTLVIKDLKYDDRNEYICIGKSEYDGEIHLTTLVRVKSKLAPLWPAIGIGLEALVIFIVILICEKRRKRKEALEEEEQSKKQ